MSFDLQQLDMIDLLSERHMLLRRVMEQDWNAISEVPIANSEWYMMSRIYKQETTISHITKNVNISRQATHKVIKKLVDKQLVEVRDHEQNKKLKSIQLTAYGEKCFEQYAELMQNLERKIADTIGKDRLFLLKDLLKLDWEIERQA